MSEGLELLQYVFAGLVASWVFYGLTTYKRPTPFERLVQALIYTAVVQLTAGFIVNVAGEGWWAKAADISAGEENLIASPLLVLTLALALGFILAVAANNNFPHKHLIKFPPNWWWTKWLWKITSKSLYGNNLSHAFETRNEYVVLTMKNGRRIFGWPELWPDHPHEDYFLLLNYEWLLQETDGDSAGEGEKGVVDASAAGGEKKLSQGAILIAAKDVDVVEFIHSEKTTF